MSSRICIISDAIVKPFDEGVKIFVYNLIKEFSIEHEILGLSQSDQFEKDIEPFCKKAIPKNKLYISFFLMNEIRKFKPDVIYYIPVACATFNSFIRARILKLYGSGTKTVMITLLPRSYSLFESKIIPYILPDMVLAQSHKTETVLKSLGCNAKKISVGVDTKRFIPVCEEVKKKLRKKYNLPKNKYIVLHVGHINKNRNVQFLEKIQGMHQTQSVVVGSTSTLQDQEVAQELTDKGVIVITNYINNIAEIYQCADCYVFPVFSDGACIEIPLSVFEAMSCNIPVVTTEFGALPNLIREQEGFLYAKTEHDIINSIDRVKCIKNPRTRNMAQQYSWGNVAKQVIQLSEIQ